VARYRNDDWPGAVDALQKSIEIRSGGDSFDWFFLAMIEWRSGHEREARQWFQQAVDWMEKNRPEDDELTRFRAEAEAALAGPVGK
jgi:hypothetical protein